MDKEAERKPEECSIMRAKYKRQFKKEGIVNSVKCFKVVKTISVVVMPFKSYPISNYLIFLSICLIFKKFWPSCEASGIFVP